MTYINRTGITYTLECDLSGSAAIQWLGSYGAHNQGVGFGSWEVQLGEVGLARCTYDSCNDTQIGFTLHLEVGQILGGLSGSFQTPPDLTTCVTSGAGWPSGFNNTVTGSVVVNFVCDEHVDLTYGTPVTDPQKVDTFPYAIDMLVSLWLKVGSTVSATLIYGGYTITASGTVLTSTQVVPKVIASCNSLQHPSPSYVTNLATIASVTPRWGGLSMSGVTPNSYSASGYAWAWGGAISCQSDGVGDATIQVTSLGTITYDVSGQVRSWNDAYTPDGLTVDCYNGSTTDVLTVTGGGYSDTINQNACSWICSDSGSTAPTLPGWVATGGINTYGPVYAGLTGASLTAKGEDPDISTFDVWFRGWIWDAMTIYQTQTLTAWTGSDTATGAGGSIVIASSALDTRLKGSWMSGVSFAGYSYATFYLTADAANQPATINLDGKQWQVIVQTTGTVTIDLDNPTNAASSADGTNSAWQFTGSPFNLPMTQNASERSGVRNLQTITINALAAGHVYTLTEIDLVVQDQSNVTFLDAYKGWVQWADSWIIGSVTTTEYKRMARQGDTDGQQSLEQTDWIWQHTDNGGGITTDTFSAISIAGVVALLASGGDYPTDGWVATDLLPAPTPGSPLYVHNDLINSSQPSCQLFGAGATYDGTSWNYGIDKNCQTSQTIKGQYLFSNITGYSGMGDLWGWYTSGFGTATELRPCTYLKAQPWGIVASTSGTTSMRETTTSVTVKEGASDDGSTTTGVQGEFEGATPYVMGLHTAVVTAIVGTNPSFSMTGVTRRRQRVAFNQPPIGGTTWNHQKRGKYSECLTSSSGLMFSMANGSDPKTGWLVVNSTVSTNAADIRPRWDRDHRRRLQLYFERPRGGGSLFSDCYYCFSDDEGASWSTPVLTYTGSKRSTIWAWNGRMLSAAFVPHITGGMPDNYGTINAIFQGPGDLSPGTPFTFQEFTSGPPANLMVADSDFHFVSCDDAPGRVVMVAVRQGGTVTTRFMSSNDGATWVEIT